MLSLGPGLLWVGLVQILLLIGAIWLMPRLARRDFLFGVFMGVDRRRLRTAPRIFRIWNLGLLVVAGIALIDCLLLWALDWRASALVMPHIAVLLGGVFLYLYCHNEARQFGVRSPRVAVSPVKETSIVREPVPLLLQVLPWILFLGFFVWTWLRWSDIPHEVPRAFEAGNPLTWMTRSWQRVFLGFFVAFATLLVPLHLASVMAARPRPRLRDPGTELEQKRSRIYRRAFAWYLWGLGMLMAVVVCYVQWDSIRGMAGAIPLGRGPVVAALCVTSAAFIGAVLLAIRLAQLFFRPEEEQTMRDELPIETRWIAGLFYFNPEDPAFLIVPRFGWGFNVNFGNRYAMAIAVTLALLVLTLALLPLLFLTVL